VDTIRRHCRSIVIIVIALLGVMATGKIALAQNPRENVVVQQLLEHQRSTICRDGYLLATPDMPLLCIDTRRRGPETYQNALVDCRRRGNQGSLGRIATFDDLSLVYLVMPDVAAEYSPVDELIGPIPLFFPRVDWESHW